MTKLENGPEELLAKTLRPKDQFLNSCRVGGRSLTQVAEQLKLYLPG
ncbi:MAG: hypothetical protein ACYDAM_09730 [Leptospirales bacterium]